METKTKLLTRATNDRDKEIIIGDYKGLQEKLARAMKCHGVSRPIGFFLWWKTKGYNDLYRNVTVKEC